MCFVLLLVESGKAFEDTSMTTAFFAGIYLYGFDGEDAKSEQEMRTGNRGSNWRAITGPGQLSHNPP